MFNKKLKLAALAVGLIGSIAASQVHAVPVDLELALLIDVSGSVDANEYLLQRNGYVQAFQSSGVQSAIAALPNGIAVTFIQWSGATQQTQNIGWTLVNSAASANAFATSIQGVSQQYQGSTAPGSAINFATPLFNNNFEGLRQVIDVSGDGSQNDGVNTAGARNAALAGDIDAINGLPILGSESGLLAWYQNNIQGGTNSFTIAAASFNDFSRAVEAKLFREITNQTPEPGSLALAGLGLLGLFGMRRRVKQA